MATVQEGFFDRSEVVGDSAEIPYIVFDADDEAEVKDACDAEIPDEYGELRLKEVQIEERVNARTWRVTASYRKPSWSWSGGATPDSRFAFDTGGGSQHVTQSLETLGRYGPKASTKLGGAIGFDGKSVQGVDITVPVFSFSETHYFTDDEITGDYKRTLFNLTGRYNGDTFRGFAVKEVLFLGAAGSRQGDDTNDLWEISFRFAASPNRSDLTVGDISGIAKGGWDYMWVQYADEADDDTQQLVKAPVAAYVERVYYAGDFSQLGIGTD